MRDSLLTDSLLVLSNKNNSTSDDSILTSFLIILLTGILTYLLFTVRTK